MYDRTELKIIERVYNNPGIHKRELSKQLKLSMPSIDFALKKVDKVLKKQKSGNQIKYFIDYKREDIIPILYAVEYAVFNRLPPKIKIAIKELLKELKDKPLITIIFGSYAKGNYTKSSDIDILLVFQKIQNSKIIENITKQISMKTNTEINPVYLNYEIFKKSFHDNTKEFFKKLRENNIILNGIEWWRELMNEEA